MHERRLCMFSSITILYARGRLFVCQCFRSQARLSSPQMHEGVFICLVASLPFTHEDDFLCVSVSGHTHGCQAHKRMTGNYAESPSCLCVFQMIPLNRSQRQAHPCSTKGHGYALPRVTFVCLSRKPNGSTGVSSYLGSERHVAPLQKPNGPTVVSSVDAALVHRPWLGSGYLRRTDGVVKPLPHSTPRFVCRQAFHSSCSSLFTDHLRHGWAEGDYSGRPCPVAGGDPGSRGFLVCKFTLFLLLLHSFFLSFGSFDLVCET